MIKRLICVFMFCLSCFVNVYAETAWKMDPTTASLQFTGTQNNAPVSGKFTKFTVDLNFDPAMLNDSNVKVDIDMSSLTTAMAEMTDNLKTADWFDVTTYPHAIFEANTFKKIAEDKYQADGKLTIRGKTIPARLNFTVKNVSATQLQIMGSADVKRNVFGIGQGDWASTDDIKDEVVIAFSITVNK